MQPGFNIDFKDLNSLKGLKKIDNVFINFLSDYDHSLALKLLACRQDSTSLSGLDYSRLIIELAPAVDDFLEELFNIKPENTLLKNKQHQFDIIYECRRKFIQRYALKKYSRADISTINFPDISTQLAPQLASELASQLSSHSPCQSAPQLASQLADLSDGIITEAVFARQVMEWYAAPEKFPYQIDLAARYAAGMVYNNSSLVLFEVPETYPSPLRDKKIAQLALNPYLGFNYRDQQQSLERATAHARYCLYCHNHGKDSCTHGIKNNINPGVKNGNQKNGCPLKQKISEMNQVKAAGFNLAALAIITIDNPLVAATGHRICNDCMKSCIFQKQEPVNVPLIESSILETVLNLPWGVEIYLLLTKWNPLKLTSFLPKKASNYNILITGLGPAGFTLAHYLLNEGHNVVAIDGMKISPLKKKNKPIKFWKDTKTPLSQRMPQGFGGVAEYGITSRWDKNNLLLIRLMLERRKNFALYGSVRLGSNLTTEQAFNIGFDHIALCLGAGKPKFASSADYFAKGIRSAADFLLNLQQGGAYLPGNNNSLTIRLPAVIIGCGLTAIDSAVEILNYYPVQVKNFLACYRRLTKEEIRQWSPEQKQIADEFILHAQVMADISDAEKLRLINATGGVTVCYRRSIEESPAYRLNPEEIEHALAMGVKFTEHVTPEEIITDEFSWVKAVAFKNKVINARTVLLAIGTENNKFSDIKMPDDLVPDDSAGAIDSKFTYFGDCTRQYGGSGGSVVQALASVKNNYHTVTNLLKSVTPALSMKFSQFKNILDVQLQSILTRKNILSDNLTELTVYSPSAALNFKPGQFFRLQNYTSNISKAMKPLALNGGIVDKEKGLVSLVIRNKGKSSNLCRNLKVGKKVSLMGPVGAESEALSAIFQDNNIKQKIILIGSGINNAGLVAINDALKQAGYYVIYFASYNQAQDRFWVDRIEAADQVIWCCREELLSLNRKQDLTIQGNVIEAIRYFINLNKDLSVNYVICRSSATLAESINKYKEELFGNARLFCNINAPMQCMMQGICGQCLQKVNDGRGYIFSCINQEQDAAIIDFAALNNRLQQNSVSELVRKNKQTV